MRNPFRTEEEAFRFVWLTILYAALIVAGSFINVWVGLGVFVVETALIIWWIFMRGRGERPIQQAPPPHPEGERRILVVANETVGGAPLLEQIRKRSSDLSLVLDRVRQFAAVEPQELDVVARDELSGIPAHNQDAEDRGGRLRFDRHETHGRKLFFDRPVVPLKDVHG